MLRTVCALAIISGKEKKISIAAWYSCIIYQYCFTALLLASMTLLKHFSFDWFYYAQFLFSYKRIFFLYTTCVNLWLFSGASLPHIFDLAYVASKLVTWFLCLVYIPFLSLCGNELHRLLHYSPTASLLLEGNQSLRKVYRETLNIINTSHQ